MTRFARKQGVLEKKESKKKQEDATEWSEMVKPKPKPQQETQTNENSKDIKENTSRDKNDVEEEKQSTSNETTKRVLSAQTALKLYGEYIDKEVLDDLNSMLESKKMTEEEFSNAVIHEGRSNRRRQERQEKRESDRVCFNCRKHGHTVEECPEVRNDCRQGTGICYKCGSTEHSVNKCKLRLEPNKFPYATCFICKEQGHLSKQCPDNPRGLYPNGGSCKSCGSVEHYYRDCPEVQAKNSSVEWKTVKKLRSYENFEELSDDEKDKRPKPQVKRIKKDVVFK